MGVLMKKKWIIDIKEGWKLCYVMYCIFGCGFIYLLLSYVVWFCCKEYFFMFGIYVLYLVLNLIFLLSC